LNIIEGTYYSFFEETNTNILYYIEIETNKDKNWVNVIIKENSGLPEAIRSEIERTFKFYE